MIPYFRADNDNALTDLERTGDWGQDFFERSSELEGTKRKATAWHRHDVDIYNQVEEWFSVVEKELCRQRTQSDRISMVEKELCQPRILRHTFMIWTRAKSASWTAMPTFMHDVLGI